MAHVDAHYTHPPTLSIQSIAMMTRVVFVVFVVVCGESFGFGGTWPL